MISYFDQTPETFKPFPPYLAPDINPAGDPFHSMVGRQGTMEIMELMVDGWRKSLRVREPPCESLQFEDCLDYAQHSAETIEKAKARNANLLKFPGEYKRTIIEKVDLNGKPSKIETISW